jgi:hypothetical protein
MAKFQKGHPQYGHRKKGQLGIKATLAERLRLKDFDPVDALIDALKAKTDEDGNGEELSLKDKAHISLELLSFLYPKLKGVEHTGKDGGPIEVAQTAKITALLSDPEAFAALETIDKKLNGPKNP